MFFFCFNIKRAILKKIKTSKRQGCTSISTDYMINTQEEQNSIEIKKYSPKLKKHASKRCKAYP
jgi:hypothetical protein